MKKKISCVLALAAIFTLASCGGNKSGDGVLTTGNWNASDVDANIKVEEKEIVNDSYSVASNKSIYSVNFVNDTYAKNGLLVLKNQYDNIGFYSLIHDKYLINCQYSDELLDYDVKLDSYIGYFLHINYGGLSSVYDALGNRLINDTYGINYINYSTSLIKGYVYLTITTNIKTSYYKYNSFGDAISVSYLPDATTSSTTISTKNEFIIGDTYVDIAKIDLKDFGLENYYLSSNGTLYTLFDNSNNKKISTFNLPTNSKIMLINNNLYYQQSYELSDEANNYSYLKNGVKYSLETYKIDILKGTKESVELKYLINNEIMPYKDSNNNYNRALVTIQRINNDKVLIEEEKVLIDIDGNIVNNLTGYEPESFIKILNMYYNTKTKILYDSSLNEKVYLSSLKPTYNKDYKCFIGSINGKYGILDVDGKVKVPFRYDDLTNNKIINGKILGTYDESLYVININNGSAEEVGHNYIKISDSMYMREEYSKYEFRDLYSNSYVAEVFGDNCQNLNNYSTYFYNNNVFKITNGNAIYNYINVTNKKAPNYDSFKPYGNEINEHVNFGFDQSSAGELKEGKNQIILYKSSQLYNNGNYYKFSPLKTGYYSLGNIFEGYTINLVSLTTPTGSSLLYSNTNVSYDSNSGEYTAYFEAGKDYYFRLSSTYLTKNIVELELKMETGSNIKYPYVLEFYQSNDIKVLSGYNYYQYTNTTEIDKTIIFNATDSMFTDNTVTLYRNQIQGAGTVIANNSLISIKAGETVYFRVDANKNNNYAITIRNN